MPEYFLKIKKYRDWSIKIKLLTISTLLILSSVSLVSIFSYIQYTNDFNTQSAKRVQQIIDQVSLNIDAYLNELFRLSLSPYLNNNIMSCLESTALTESEQLDKTRAIESYLKEMMIIPRQDILRVYILSDSVYSSIRTQTGMDAKTDFRKFDWYQEALETREAIFIPVHTETVDKNPDLKIFSIVKQLRSSKYADKILGVIKVDADYTGIQSICSKINMGREGSLYIIDADKNVIYRNSSANTYFDKYFPELYKKVKNNRDGFFTTEMDRSKYLVNYVQIPRSNWSIIAVNSVKELNKNASGTRNLSLLLAFLCASSAIFILVLFIRRFLTPLLSIVKLMKEVQNGNMHVKFKETGHDEIGYLGSSFNTMVLRINEMLEQNTFLVKEVIHIPDVFQSGCCFLSSSGIFPFLCTLEIYIISLSRIIIVLQLNPDRRKYKLPTIDLVFLLRRKKMFLPYSMFIFPSPVLLILDSLQKIVVNSIISSTRSCSTYHSLSLCHKSTSLVDST